ncbi:MAG TPA: hypothetical protein VFZ61_26885 [Polyangiales bacterium]
MYAPCGEDGVLRATLRQDGSLEDEALLRVAGKVEAVFLRGETIWVELLRTEARPLAELAQTSAPLASLPGMPQAHTPPARPRGDVVAQSGLELTISLGTEDGLKIGDSVEFYTESGDNHQETPLAVGEVVRASRDDAQVQVGLGERVPNAAAARPTTRHKTRSLVAPPRAGGVMLLEGGVVPYLPIGALGVGALANLAFTYLGERPFYLRAEIAPAGGVIASGTNGVVFAAHALGGYDHTFFAVGVGVGLLLGSHSILADDYEAYGTDAVFSFKQSMRLGTRDGLNLRVDTSFALADRQWHFAYTEGSGQIPLGSRTWLILSGGGGEVGRFVHGSLGLRRMVRGNGGSGSLFVKPSVGMVGIERKDSSTMDAGPAVGIHLEWRI